MIETSLPPQKRSWFMATSIVAFLMVATFSVYFQVRSAQLNNLIVELTAEKELRSAPVPTSETAGSETLDSVAAVQKAIAKINAGQLEWAKIIEKIETTLPKAPEASAPLVRFTTYTGGTDGKISVSGVTSSTSKDPLADIALVIRTFTSDPAFSNVFVPSINKSITPDGVSVLSFSMNFTYQKPTL